MPKFLTIARALDPRLLGAALGGDLSTWATWTAVLQAAFGMELDADELATFASVAGGRAVPRERVRELWCIAGRRSGKSRMAALIGVYLAVFVKHTLAAGERGMVLILAGSQDQARVVFGYCKAFLEASPALRREIVDATRTEIRLRNGVTLAIHANSFRTVRGRTLCGVVFDEIATWRSDESAQPDGEVYSAVLPALLTTRGMLVGISTGYKRAGILFEKHRDHFGQDSADVLVIQGGTTTFNRTIAEADIAAQRAADPGAAAAEWDGLFRADVASFLDEELIEAATDLGRPLELPARSGCEYRMFVDASGGASGGDAYAVAIGHKERDAVVVDVVRGVVGKFDPQRVTKVYAALAKEYGIGSVSGDHYAAEWVASAWAECGISYVRVEPTGSQIYLEVLPLFARGLARLPNHAGLLRELRLLERRAQRGGRDIVDHPRNEHDDHAAAACGALWLAQTAVSALWAREKLVGSGSGAAPPVRADVIFATVVSDATGQLAAAYFVLGLRNHPPLALLDVEFGPLRSEALLGIGAKLRAMHQAVHSSGRTAIYTSTPLGNELVRLGYNPDVVVMIDRVLADELLAVSSSIHVAANKVQACAEAMNKNFPLTFLGGAPAPKTDPLAQAFCAGVAVALAHNLEAA